MWEMLSKRDCIIFEKDVSNSLKYEILKKTRQKNYWYFRRRTKSISYCIKFQKKGK